MNEFRIRTTGTSVNEQEFRLWVKDQGALEGKDITLPDQLSPEIVKAFGADPVLASPQPTLSDFQSAQKVGAVQDALGNWVQGWAVRNWSAEEIAAHKAASKVSRWEAIKADRDRRKGWGVKVNIDATAGDKWFHSDDSSRIQQLGLVIMGASIPVGLQWKTMDGSFVTMTQTLASKLFNAVAIQDQAIFKRAEEHKTAMEAANNHSTYDFSTGWPITFGA